MSDQGQSGSVEEMNNIIRNRNTHSEKELGDKKKKQQERRGQE